MPGREKRAQDVIDIVSAQCEEKIVREELLSLEGRLIIPSADWTGISQAPDIFSRKRQMLSKNNLIEKVLVFHKFNTSDSFN